MSDINCVFYDVLLGASPYYTDTIGYLSNVYTTFLSYTYAL